GMRGTGRTVIKGTKIDSFGAEVLGVLRNTSPGRDMILCRLSGLDLEKTGVIAGMSGSPIYVNGKLLGAVAYAWSFGKEPIAGVTPFSQMHGFVESYEQRDLVDHPKPTRVGLAMPMDIGGRIFDSVNVPEDPRQPRLWLGPSLFRHGRMRVPAHDRLHPRNLSAANRELQDGQPAADGRRH